jgi:hypothetical protein
VMFPCRAGVTKPFSMRKPGSRGHWIKKREHHFGTQKANSRPLENDLSGQNSSLLAIFCGKPLLPMHVIASWQPRDTT